MRYTILGKTGIKASVLGFGCMRLPMKAGRVDRDKSTPLLRRAVELGVNFFDSATMYCGSDSEAAIGEAFEKMRGRVLLSTKNPIYDGTADDWRRKLEASLKFMRTDHLDLYNHHGMSWENFRTKMDPDKNGLTREMIRARDEGLVRHIGFSCHDSPENMKKIMDTGIFENVILQYNLIDQVNAEAMRYAKAKGIGVVVMGSVGGGRLGLPSEKIVELFNGEVSSTPEAALRFVWAHPTVCVALSGMENIQMLEQNVRVADKAGAFTPDQIASLNRLVLERKKRSGLYCTGCKYCTPSCPLGMPIPEHLDMLNMALIYGLNEVAAKRYKDLGVKAPECVVCRACAGKCPQKIDIPAKLRQTAMLLDSRAGRVSIGFQVREMAANGSFNAGLSLQNFTDMKQDVKVNIVPAGEVTVSTAAFEIGGLDPFKPHHVAISGAIPPNSRIISMKTRVEYGGVTNETEINYRFIVVQKGQGHDWNSGEWLAATPGPQDFGGNARIIAAHSFRFNLSWNGEAFLLLADVRDDFLFPSRKENNQWALVDGLELFLDGRKPDRIGRPNYEKGVYQVMLYPGTPGKHPAFFSAKEPMDIDIAAERTAEGFRIRAVIPFKSFCVAPGVPRKIGFDLAANTADAHGARIGQYVFAGAGNNWQNASGFREAWLIG